MRLAAGQVGVGPTNGQVIQEDPLEHPLIRRAGVKHQHDLISGLPDLYVVPMSLPILPVDESGT